MSSQLINEFSAAYCKDEVPVLEPGMIVKVHQRIKEGSKERIQLFEGTVIATGAGEGVSSTFTVRKISKGIGVEKCYPIHSPSVVKIEVMRDQKTRRAKLNFLRDRSGKALRLKEVPLKLRMKKKPVVTTAKVAEEAPVAETESAA